MLKFNENDLLKLNKKDKWLFNYHSQLYKQYNRTKYDNKKIRNFSLKRIIDVFKKNNIEFKLNY